LLNYSLYFLSSVHYASATIEHASVTIQPLGYVKMTSSLDIELVHQMNQHNISR